MRSRHPPRCRQRGAVAILVGLTIVVLIGLLGIVIDLGALYIRKTELQNAADAAALAGAKELNGQPAGIDSAVKQAIAIAKANASDFGHLAVDIGTPPGSATDSSHVWFGTTPDGPWVDATTAKVNPGPFSFILVDTSGMTQETRATWFMPVINSALATTTANGRAVGGAPVCEGMPVFICLPAGGFTAGRPYFFAESPGYPIGPGNIGYFDPVPSGAPKLINGASDMRQVICAGKTYCLGTGTYKSLTQAAFGTMADAFNTRFDVFTGVLKDSYAACRPDSNIMEYRWDNELKPTPPTKPSAWMATAPASQLGVSWSAVRPATLPGTPAVNTTKYPSAGSGGGTPYSQPLDPSGSATTFTSQPLDHLADAATGRRIITMAIVDNCGAINGSGKDVHVVGFGRFFMPVKAKGTGSPKGIYVEYIETVPRLTASAPDLKLYR